MKLYAVTAQQTITLPDGYTVMHQVPTFYLNADTQGIVNTQHAEKIAQYILAGDVRYSNPDNVSTSIDVQEI